MTVTGEKPFSIMAHSFVISASGQGYTLNYSADGNGFTAWEEATPANEVLVVNDIAKGMVFYLSGNTDTVEITY